MWNCVQGSGKYFVPARNMGTLLTFAPLAAAGPPPILVETLPQLPPPPPPEGNLGLETPTMASAVQNLLLALQEALLTENDPDPPFLPPALSLFLLIIFCAYFFVYY